MSFNPKKCQVLRITRKKTPVIFNYVIGNHTLDSTDTAKYLGVHLSRDLSWTNHINYIAKKASSTSAFLQRNIHVCPRQTKVLCYKAPVRPVMEYACTVWDPHTQKNITIKKLEMVQRKYARFIFNNFQCTSSVSTMLNHAQPSAVAISPRKTRPVQGGEGVQVCRQTGRYTSNILPSCTSCNIKRTHPKVCHSFCKNPHFPAIFLPGFHWPMEFAAPGDAVQLSISFNEMCRTYNSATNGRSCFLLAPAMHVV